MKNIIIPKKLKKTSHIRIIAPSRSMSLLSQETKDMATRRLTEFGFSLSFGQHVNEIDSFNSSSIKSRIEDLHAAFSDPKVDGIMTVIGGYNSNQLLDYIDYDLISKNPKPLCGFSDISALGNAILSKTGMVTYYGPHYSSWAMLQGFEYSIQCFVRCLMEESPFIQVPSEQWSDDPWYLDQKNREFINSDGYWIINNGHAVGRTVGGHQRCLNALQGTEYWPGLEDSILLLEEDAEINPQLFDRQLQSLIHQPDFVGVRGILIGRFQRDSKMTREIIASIIATKSKLNHLPIIANVNFGHTTPIATLPIGGSLEMLAENGIATIKIIEH